MADSTKTMQAQADQKRSLSDRSVTYTAFGERDPITISVGMVRNMLTKPTKSGALPSDDTVMAYLVMARSMQLNPFCRDCFLVGYDSSKDKGPEFSIIVAHQAFLKRAESHPEFDGMASGVIVEDEQGNMVDREGDFLHGSFVPLDGTMNGPTEWRGDKLLGGWAIVYFKNRKYPVKRRLNLHVRRKDNAFWRDDTAGMIVKCFDEETEVLTDRGFEKFADAQGRVLQVTDHGLEPTDAKPFFKTYSGPMIRHANSCGNFLVTPNHDMPIEMNGQREQKTEAGSLLELRRRDKALMPLAISGTRDEATISDAALRLAAVYIADGSDNSASSGFSASVSRPHKVAFLNGLGAHTSAAKRSDSGRKGVMASGRVVVTKADKTAFYYSRTPDLDMLVGRRKTINVSALLTLSMRQAALLLDTWMMFDGHRPDKMRCGRIFTSRLDHVQAIEILAIISGRSVSQRSERQTEGNRKNYILTVTNKAAVRLTGAYLDSIQNPGTGVWCVTVPTHKIVVRRKGFSHACYQCAEADALRSSFPTLLGGMYIESEIVPGDDAPDLQQQRPSARSAIEHLPEPAQPPKASNGRREKEPVPVKEESRPAPQQQAAASRTPPQQAAPEQPQDPRAQLIATIRAEAKRLQMHGDDLARIIRDKGGRRTIDDCDMRGLEDILKAVRDEPDF